MMGTKTISRREDVYGMLKSLKKEKESFSEVIFRLAKKKAYDIGNYSTTPGDGKKLDEMKKDYRKIRADV